MANNVNEIFKLIKGDKVKSGSYDRYPVRFLFMNLSNSTQNEITSLYKKCLDEKLDNPLFNDCEVIHLADSLLHDDTWLTKSKVLSIVKSLDKDKDYFLTGFSELARFYSRNDLESLIISLMTDIENTIGSKSRIYFVCFSLREKISEELKTNSRNESIDPVIEVEGTFSSVETLNVFYTNEIVGKSAFHNKINTAREWLQLYKATNLSFDENIICVSNTLSKLYENAKPDNFVSIEKIDNYYTVLKNIYRMDLVRSTEDSFSMAFWKELFEYAKEKDTFDLINLMKITFNVLSVSDEDIYRIMNDSTVDVFKKNFLNLLVIEKKTESQYENYVIDLLDGCKNDNYASFIKNIYTKFDQVFFVNFDSEKINSFVKSRKYYLSKIEESETLQFLDDYKRSINQLYNNHLLNSFYNIKFEYEYLDSVTTAAICSKYAPALKEKDYTKEFIIFYKKCLSKVLSGKNTYEKSLALKLYQDNLIDFDEVKDIFPAVSMYLGYSQSPYVFAQNHWISDYLYEYKLAKIKNSATDTLKNKICDNALKFFDWYYSNHLVNSMTLVKKDVDYDAMIVLDGVGAEYLDYIASKIKSMGLNLLYSNIAKCALPSITSINKEILQNYCSEWITDFDNQIIHGEFYDSSATLPKALSMLDDLLQRIASKYRGKRIAITADHGATVIGRIIDTNKKYNFDSEHEGRCCEVDKHYASCEDYVYYEATNGKKWIISTREQSLKDKPKRESHGGASVEEVAVPIIIFTDLVNAKVTKHKVVADLTPVSGLNRKIKVHITPHLDQGPVLVEESGDSHLMMQLEDDYWESDINVIKEQNAKVIISNNEYSIHIMGTLGIQNEEGDDFDD